MKLRTLSIVTGVLFITSIFVYLNENKRGTDLLTGSDYVKGLDINKIQKIDLSFSGGKKLTLKRDSNRFVLANHEAYPASTNKVNDLIYKIASIEVKEKVESGVDEDDLKKYELDNGKKKYLVEIFDNDGYKTVAFRVGKNYKGKGNYLFKEGQGDIYLSKENLWLNSSYKDFINTVLLEVDTKDIEKVSLSAGQPIEIVKKEKEFVVENPKNKKFKKEKVEEYIRSFSSLRFEEFLSFTDPKVMGLQFDKDLVVKLKNNLIYKISLAKKNDEHFVRVAALLEEKQNRFVVKQDTDKEELSKIEEMIQAQAEAQRVNLERGTWVYKINKAEYEKIVKEAKFFI